MTNLSTDLSSDAAIDLKEQGVTMSEMDAFEKAQVRVKSFAKTPGAPELLNLYSLFKQATQGDVAGKRPGLLDVRGRAKFDAWSAKKGTSSEQARDDYVVLVGTLSQKYAE